MFSSMTLGFDYKKQRCGNKNLMYLFLLLPYFTPGAISGSYEGMFKIFDIISNMHRLITFPIIIYLYFTNEKKPYFKYIMMIAIYSSVMVFSSIIMESEVVTSCIVLGTRCSLCMLFAIMIKKKRTRVLGSYLKAMILINLLLMLLVPEGFYKNSTNEAIFFLGHGNIFIQNMILMLSILSVCDGKRTFNFYIVICLISICLSDSKTGIVLMIFYCIMVYLSLWKIKHFIFPEKLIYFFTTIGSLVLTYAHTVITQSRVISYFVTRVLGKSLTFNYRTVLWDYAWSLIKEYPLLGLGFRQNFSGNFAHSVEVMENTAHNGILYVLFTSGGIGLFLLLALFVLCSTKQNNTVHKREIYQIDLGILVLLLDGLMEPMIFSGHIIFLMMLLQYAEKSRGRKK